MSAFDRAVLEIKKKRTPHSKGRRKRADEAPAPTAAPKSRTRANIPTRQTLTGKNEFAKLVNDKGITLRGLADKLNLRPQTLWNLSAGALSSNHPSIPLVAAALGVSEADIAKFSKRGPSSPKALAKSARVMLAKRGSTREELVVDAEITDATTPGTAIAPRQYNRLKKGQVELRQSARLLVGTLNMQVMGAAPPK